jgi:hypothetical protein
MLKTIYDTEEDIPEGYRDLYTEKNGKWELTGVQGVKTQADVDRVQAALTKERTEHKTTKASLAQFEGIDPESVASMTLSLEEAQAQLAALNKDGNVDPEKIEPIVAARLKQATAPLERDKANLERQIEAKRKEVAEREAKIAELNTSIVNDRIEREVRDAAATAKITPSAVTDAVMRARSIFEQTDDGRTVTRDVAGVTPGLNPVEWLKDMQEKAPHWWPNSVGGGSQGGGGPGGRPYAGANNPWSKEGWNITKQGAVVKTLGEAKAAEIAAQAGCKIGDTKPKAA